MTQTRIWTLDLSDTNATDQQSSEFVRVTAVWQNRTFVCHQKKQKNVENIWFHPAAVENRRQSLISDVDASVNSCPWRNPVPVINKSISPLELRSLHLFYQTFVRPSANSSAVTRPIKCLNWFLHKPSVMKGTRNRSNIYTSCSGRW